MIVCISVVLFLLSVHPFFGSLLLLLLFHFQTSLPAGPSSSGRTRDVHSAGGSSAAESCEAQALASRLLFLGYDIRWRMIGYVSPIGYDFNN